MSSITYSNAYQALEMKSSIRSRGYSPLVMYILGNKYGPLHLNMSTDPKPFELLLALVNSPELKPELTFDGILGDTITREDLLSALKFSHPEFPMGMKASVAKFAAPKYEKLETMPATEVEDEFGKVWEPVEAVIGNGIPVVNDITLVQYTPGGFQWATVCQFGYAQELKTLSKLLKCNGTFEGMLTVIRRGNEDSDFEGDLTPYFDRVKKKLPIRNKVIMADGGEFSLASSFASHFFKLDINEKARAGIPFQPSELADIKNVALAYKDASMLSNLFIKHDEDYVFNNLLDYYPYLLVARLANKTAVYDYSNIKQKTRPYYILPLAIRILGCSIYQLMKDRVMALNDPSYECESMLGFSWFHGGATKLFQYIINYPEGKLGKLAYADDFSLFVRQGNVVKLASPDFSHMDGSIRKAHTLINSMYDEYRVGQHKGSERDRRVVRFMNMLVTEMIVCVQGPCVYYKDKGSNSGHPNTTGVNQTVSAIASCMMDDLWAGIGDHEGYDFDTFEDFMVDYKSYVLENLGMVVKEGTGEVFTARTALDFGEIFPINFLGQNLTLVRVREESVVVPVANTLNLLKAYIWAPGAVDAGNKYDERLSRSIGIALSGGAVDEKFYKMLAADYNGCLAARRKDKSVPDKGISPKALSDLSDDFDVSTQKMYGEVFHQISMDILKKHDWNKNFAPREWFLSLFSETILESTKLPTEYKKHDQKETKEAIKRSIKSLKKNVVSSSNELRTAKQKQNFDEEAKAKFMAEVAAATPTPEQMAPPEKKEPIASVPLKPELKEERKTAGELRKERQAQKRDTKKKNVEVTTEREVKGKVERTDFGQKIGAPIVNPIKVEIKAPTPKPEEKVPPFTLPPKFHSWKPIMQLSTFFKAIEKGVDRQRWLVKLFGPSFHKLSQLALKNGAGFDVGTSVWGIVE